MAKKKKKDQDLTVSEAQKVVAYLYHKKEKEDELLRNAAYVLLQETNPEFDYEVEPKDTGDIQGIDQAASVGANAAATAAATTAATAAATTASNRRHINSWCSYRTITIFGYSRRYCYVVCSIFPR